MLQEKENRSGAGASQRRKWPYYGQMKSLFSGNSYRKRKKRKTGDMVTSAFTSVQSEHNSFMQIINKGNRPTVSVKKDYEIADGQDYDCYALVGKLVATRLNEMSPSSVKNKRKQIMKCLIDDDNSEESS
ncbi:hypothetical protein TSAR_010516 [Trichomalopsis sarcophagae]|uniref:Uncharacterized protein n=1 Tax=Trichomalopsis sarcophagae TaxID=543379 RepID=A0A232EM09_9HYME|nr:hypothetical protein TSAR_010516 [Trichomalopsis sarcophagae]